MLELGRYTEEEHEKIIKLLNGYECQEVILVGRIFSRLPHTGNYLRFEDVDKLTEWLIGNPLQGRFILIKGSRGIRLEKCVPVL
jgi:UDP-N-acetylmuramoyl-tripeptide--D-alanyl-D-alanine ligase